MSKFKKSVSILTAIGICSITLLTAGCASVSSGNPSSRMVHKTATSEDWDAIANRAAREVDYKLREHFAQVQVTDKNINVSYVNNSAFGEAYRIKLEEAFGKYGISNGYYRAGNSCQIIH